MLYHGLVAMAGVLVLLGGWLLVQRLGAASATQDATAPDGCALPGGAEAGPACGGCAACGPGAGRPESPLITGELARDGPANEMRQ